MFWSRLIVRLVVGSFLVVVLPGGCQTSSNQTVVVSIADKHGKSISISKDNLTLTIDGKPTAVSDLIPATDQPLGFAVLLDASGSMRDKVDFSKNASTTIFKVLSTASNKGFVGVFAEKYAVSDAPVTPDEVKQIIYKTVPHGGTSLLSAVSFAIERRINTGLPDIRRRSVLLISDGDENASQLDLSSTIETAQKFGVNIVVVGLLSSDGESSKAKQVLQHLASETGGLAVLLDGPSDYLQRVSQYFQQQYLLTFTSPVPADGKLHLLEIRVSEKGARVAAPSKLLLK